MAVTGVMSRNEQPNRLSQTMKAKQSGQSNQSQKKQTKKTERQEGVMSQGNAGQAKGTGNTRDKAQIAKANASKMSAKGSIVDKVA